MKSVAEIIRALKKDNPIFSNLLDFDLEAVWENSMDSTIKRVSAIDKFENGCLFLRVKDSVWLTQLSILKIELIEKINKELKRDVVKDVKFKLGKIANKANKNNTRNVSSKKLPEEVEKKLNKSLEGIEDDELKKTLKRIFIESFIKSADEKQEVK